MKRKKIIIAISAALTVSLVFAFSNSGTNKYNNAINEPSDEKTYISDAISSAVRIITHSQSVSAPAPYRRDAHAKAHGCLKATFTVPQLNNPILKQGLFSQPKQYQAWIRFSNGFDRPQSDNVKDARGMAIKVMGVDGEKLLKAEQDEMTQDFVMLNNPTFFLPNVKEYTEFIQYQAQGSQFGFFFNNFNWNIFKWHFKDLFLGMQILKKPPKSLLTEQYHSLTAYRLGNENFMKYSAKSCGTNEIYSVDRDADNFLRTELKEQLSKGNACFDFLVQIQNPHKNMPIEDTRILWDPKDSPFIHVAKIEIPQQSFDNELQNNFCENLSFTPWHSVEALEPVGGLNRLRKIVYTEISRFRHSKNNVERHEPKGWCLALNGEKCPSS
ncbi:MAG: catalase family protein [Colwellia sp.]|nr:catalase family protein [Colwellia sp.]